MAQDRSHERTAHRLTDMDRFPPTVVGHTEYRDGIELDLLDPGPQEEPRFVWIPDEGETVFSL